MKKHLIIGLALLAALMTATSSSLAKGNTKEETNQYRHGNAVVVPSVMITSPEDGAAINEVTLDVIAAFGPKEKGKGNVRYIILKLDGKEVAQYQNPANIKEGTHTFTLNISQAAEGVHTLQAFAYQGEIKAGHEGSSAPISVIIDRTPPVTKDDYKYNDIWTNTDVHITLTVEDNLSGAAHTFYTINGTEYEGTAINITQEGTYTIEYWSVDTAGNIETKHTLSVKIDKTLPLITDLLPTNNALFSNATPIISCVYSDELSGINTATVKLIVDDQDITSQAAITDTNLSYTPAAPLVDGSHTIKVDVTDKTGNAAQSSWAFTVDTTPSAITITTPQEKEYPIDIDITLNFIVTDITSGVKEIFSTLDDIPVSNGDIIDLEGLGVGEHTLTIQAADNANNSAALSVTFAVYIPDTTPPTITVTQPQDSSTIETTTPLFIVTYSDETSGIDAAAFSCLINNTEAKALFTISESIALYQVPQDTPLPQGENTILASIKDKAGNESQAAAKFTITCDSDGDGLLDSWEMEHFGSLDYGAADDPDNDGLTNIEEYNYGTNPAAFDSDGDGYSDGVEINQSTDPLDPENHSDDTTPPAITITSPEVKDYPSFNSITIDFTVTDDLSGVHEVISTLDGLPVVSGDVISLADLSIGTHTLSVTAADYINNSTSAAVTFAVFNVFQLEPIDLTEAAITGGVYIKEELKNQSNRVVADYNGIITNQAVLTIQLLADNIAGIDACTSAMDVTITTDPSAGTITLSGLIEGMYKASVSITYTSGETTSFRLITMGVGSAFNPADYALDPDEDGLPNWAEYIYATDPLNPDTDDGGLKDGAEVTAGLNPLNPIDDTGDLDGDGLSNLTEQKLGTEPDDKGSCVEGYLYEYALYSSYPEVGHVSGVYCWEWIETEDMLPVNPSNFLVVLEPWSSIWMEGNLCAPCYRSSPEGEEYCEVESAEGTISGCRFWAGPAFIWFESGKTKGSLMIYQLIVYETEKLLKEIEEQGGLFWPGKPSIDTTSIVLSDPSMGPYTYTSTPDFWWTSLNIEVSPPTTDLDLKIEGINSTSTYQEAPEYIPLLAKGETRTLTISLNGRAPELAERLITLTSSNANVVKFQNPSAGGIIKNNGVIVEWNIEPILTPVTVEAIRGANPAGGCTIKAEVDSILNPADQRADACKVQFYPGAGVDPLFVPVYGSSEEVSVIGVNMTAYRPQTTPFQWWEYTIPDEDEENPGAGIRINGDDDNENGISDRIDTSVAGEDDLIKVKIEVPFAPAPTGFEYVLKRNNSNIKVWSNFDKPDSAILNTNNEQVIPFSTYTKNVWVEYSGTRSGTADLELQLRNTQDQTVVCSDKIHFYPFRSVVLAFGGKGGVPADPPNELDGVFIIAKDLYLQGYDVYMFAETGRSDARAEVKSAIFAINNRGVSQVGIFGYSLGGNETYELQKYLKNQIGFGISFHTKFTAYIDAIKKIALSRPLTERTVICRLFA